MLRCLVQEQSQSWDDILPQAEFAYNSMPNRSTGKCPFSIVYTKLPNHTVDIAMLPKCKSSAAASLAEQFANTLQDVRSKIIESNSKYKQAADQHRRQQIFSPGDLVMVRLRRERFAPGSYSKLSRRKVGPIPVLKKINDNAYIVDLPVEYNTSSTFNVADITPYHPPDNAPTMATPLEQSSSSTGET
ncbi:hypothetical protein MA16_Dca016952 [Dendrobium catenatum]|uniref:Tf2-1-like SH3-like domain-containing protein n=1 Tax=Dendrobium catenatum TaxID=906689 RepID=A0A2I0VWJ6_9ASPA|nr:hypothetical protein MA16_Dca016952 [Dendrobium catenatum]